MREQFAHWLWRGRAWRGKTAVILGSVFASLIVIGIVVPAPEDDLPPRGDTAPVTTERTTTKEEAIKPTKKTPPSPLLVAKVVNGDTIDLDNGARIRLVQIDAPQLGGACYGRKASNVLRGLLPVGTRVRLIRDRKLDNADSSGRLLRYVFVGGKNINLALVKRGAASPWYSDGSKGRYAAKLLRAAERANAAERGAWGACEAKLDALAPFQTRQKQIAPKPEPEPEPVPESEPANCHPSYSGACLDPNSYDYDCAGGSGNGPDYVDGPIYVTGDDPFDLDRDGDGVACES